MSRLIFAAFLAGMVAIAPASASADDAPVISGVNVFNPFSTAWVIDGYVTDEDPSSCMVIIDGVVFDVSSAASDGYFQFAFYLAPGYAGPVDIYAFDAGYQLSNVESTTVGN